MDRFGTLCRTFILIAPLTLASCASKFALNEEMADDEVSEKLGKYVELSEQGMACSYNSECKIVEYGYNSCYNYENYAAGYIVYSTLIGNKRVRELRRVSKLSRKLFQEREKEIFGAEHTQGLERMCTLAIKRKHRPRCVSRRCK